MFNCNHVATPIKTSLKIVNDSVEKLVASPRYLWHIKLDIINLLKHFNNIYSGCDSRGKNISDHIDTC